MSALEKMRKLVAKLDDVSERPHHGDVMFYVGKKPFASAGPKGMVIGLEPEHAALLVEKDARFRPYARDARAVMFDPAEVPQKEWEPLVRESYAMAAATAKKSPAKKPSRPRSR